MKIKLLLLINLIFINSASVPLGAEDINKIIKKGLEQSYAFEWEEADQTFNKIIKDYPDDPRGYHYLSSIYLWYYLSSSDEKDLTDFVTYSDLAIEKGKEHLNENPEDEITLYTLGSAYTYRTIAFAKAEDYLDAVWASRESENYLSKALIINPENFDSYLGLGLYNFAVAQIPSAFRWALNLAGIKGSKEKGVQFITLAASKGTLAKVEAEYYLSQILTEVLFNYDAAAVHLKNLVKEYPANILFNYSYAALEIKRRNLNQAEKILSKIVGRDKNNFRQVIAFSNFLMGDIFFKKNEFDSAKVYYQIFLDTASGKDYTGIAAYRLALSYELTGDRNGAESYFMISSNGNYDLEDDTFARRKGEIYSKRTLSRTEQELIKTSNMIESGNYNEAYDSLLTFIDNINAEKLIAETNLYLCEASYWLGNYDESLKYALAAMSFNNPEEKWIKPFASFYAARAHKKLKNLNAAKSFLEEAENYNGYDYQNKLENMIDAFSNSLETPLERG